MEASFFSILIFLLSRSLPSSLSVPALTWCARALSFFLFSLLSSARNTRISALLPASGRPSPKLSRRKEQADKRSLSLQHLRDRPIDLRAFFSRSPSRPSPPPPLSLCTPSLSTNTNSMLSALIAAMATAARSSVSSSGTRMATTTTTKLVARRFSAALSPAPRPSLPGCSSARSMPSALRAYAADAALVSKNNGKKEERPLFETANLAI